MKKFASEFKEFVMRGNVMDMAVGVIIGGAFTGIVTALTTNIINPLITVITPPPFTRVSSARPPSWTFITPLPFTLAS